MKQELGVVIDELRDGKLSSGRRYEKLASTDSLYSVRLSRAYRVVFFLSPDSGTALPVAVGPHDETYSRALRRSRNRPDNPS